MPSEDLAYIFEHTKTGAEPDPTFLCFEEEYYRIQDMLTKDFTIVDLGCAYAFQAYL